MTSRTPTIFMAIAMVTASSTMKTAAHAPAVDAFGGGQVLVHARGAAAAATARRRRASASAPPPKIQARSAAVTANTSPNRKPMRSTGGPLTMDAAMTPRRARHGAEGRGCESSGTTCWRPSQSSRRDDGQRDDEHAERDVERQREAERDADEARLRDGLAEVGHAAARRRSSRAAPRRRRARGPRARRATGTAQARSVSCGRGAAVADRLPDAARRRDRGCDRGGGGRRRRRARPAAPNSRA